MKVDLIIMENRKLITVDEKEAIGQARGAANQISRRSQADIAALGSDVYRMMEEGYL
ncbi:hypothetical protein [Brevibacillus reuszeri]|uniref:hypothetical protein n=1 Tax=Brevibacillus reuszeri TaxID=54915 RepID=UPI0013DFED04|nr:hypothetical protein [Brevibacillus reuszeri]